MNEDCEIIRDLLPLYADDICSTSTKELVEKHLNNCNECQKILEIMKKDENAKFIKDVSAASVLIVGICFFIVEGIILIPKLITM